MDFSYAPPPLRAKRSGTQLTDLEKRPKLDLFEDLPTHLPNTTPTTAPKTDLDVVEEVHTKKSEPIFIEGTTITLQTEEDIAKWIEERRKNWPTRKNIENKKAQLELKAVAEVPKETPLGHKKQVCKFYARNGKCKFGAKCKNSHEVANSGGHNRSGGNVKSINGIKVNIPQRYTREASEATSGSLFKKLVQRDLFENQNNAVMDFVLYLDAQGIIDRDTSM